MFNSFPFVRQHDSPTLEPKPFCGVVPCEARTHVPRGRPRKGIGGIWSGRVQATLGERPLR